MSYKRFSPQDLIYSTLVAKPAYKFTVHSGSVYKNLEILEDGNFSNKEKHISNGEISLHEININRPADSLVYSFIEKDTTRYANRSISTRAFDDQSQFALGAQVTQSYPMKVGLSRIFVDEGAEFSSVGLADVGAMSLAAANKKYIRSLKNVINSRDKFLQSFDYADLGTKKVNIVCVPGIFYGSKIDPGSVELNYYVTGTLVSQAKDTNKDGLLIETTGSLVGATAGYIIYEQGLMLLTGSWTQGEGYKDHFTAAGSTDPTWINFGTGLPTVGTSISSQSVLSSSYEINFKGTNKIPTLTMMAFAEKGAYSYSANPTFLSQSSRTSTTSSVIYSEPKLNIANITNSDFENFDAPYVSTTYISKVGIYDEDKNLIAVATLANPIKKTPNRDFMIKMRMDF